MTAAAVRARASPIALALVAFLALLSGAAAPAASAPGSSTSSALAPGIRFEVVRTSSPAQHINVVTVAPWAAARAVLVRAGPREAPFATVSAAVERVHGLAGVNGYFTTLPPRSPMLIRDGRVVVPPCTVARCDRHPRTACGLTADGSALLVTVDGRRPGAAGMSLRELAVLMRALGAVWAVNLDGGASSTMVVRGVVTNTPSDPTGERPVASAVVLVPSAGSGISSLVRRLRALDHRITPPLPLFHPAFGALHGFRLAV
jgi:hypothetical protein